MTSSTPARDRGPGHVEGRDHGPAGVLGACPATGAGRLPRRRRPARRPAARSAVRAASKATLPPPTTTTPLAEVDPEALVDVEQELDGAQHAVEVVAGQVEVAAPSGADRQEQRVVAVEQLVERWRRRPTRKRELDVDAELDDGVDLAGDELAGEAVLGDAEHHHPAEPVGRLVDGDRVAGQAQLVGGGQPGRPAADDADRASVAGGTGPWASCQTRRASKLSTPNRSVTKRLRARMATGASTVPRRQADSHGAAQTRPQIEANGLGPRAMR